MWNRDSYRVALRVGGVMAATAVSMLLAAHAAHAQTADTDPVATLLSSLGYGKYVVLWLALVGTFSHLAPFYPPTWPGAALVRSLALLVGHAKPAVPVSAGDAAKTAAAVMWLGLLGVGSLTACSLAPAACKVDEAAVPLADDVAEAAGGVSATAAAVVHPAVVGACAPAK